MKITMTILATLLAISQLGVAEETTIRPKAETAAEWFRRLPHAKRRFINLHFYIHDIFIGPNATAYQVAKANITDQSPVRFGTVRVFDVPLLDGSDPSTATVIGHGQGINAEVAFDDANPLLESSFLFQNGTVCLFGRITQDSGMMEVPVVGGAGAFRGARGTASLTTVSQDPRERILDCNLYFEYYH